MAPHHLRLEGVEPAAEGDDLDRRISRASTSSSGASAPLKTCAAGPVIATGPSPGQAISSSPPSRMSRTRSPTSPRRRAATIAAQAPLPQASVSPAPRSNTRSRIRSGPRDLREADIGALGKHRMVLQLRAQRGDVDGVEVGHEEDGMRVAHADRRSAAAGRRTRAAPEPCRRPRASGISCQSKRGRAHVDRVDAGHRHAASSSTTAVGREPELATRPAAPRRAAAARRSACALPHAPASLPSELKKRMPRVGARRPARPARAGRTRRPDAGRRSAAAARGVSVDGRAPRRPSRRSRCRARASCGRGEGCMQWRIAGWGRRRNGWSTPASLSRSRMRAGTTLKSSPPAPERAVRGRDQPQRSPPPDGPVKPGHDRQVSDRRTPRLTSP